MEWSTDPEALFELPAGSLGADMRLLSVVHPDDRQRVEDAIAKGLKSGAYEAAYRIICSEGVVRWITERGRIITDGDADRVIGIARDVTAEREAAQERERLLRSEAAARREAEHQSRLKDEFLATLSHELRTPMNAILGWLAILDSGKPIREIHSALAVIRRNAQLQAKLIDDLLDMNRLISGNVILERTEVDLTSLVQATMQSLQPVAQQKSVQLLAVVDTGAGTMMADARRLQQVLWNVLHNAVKFTPASGRVELRVQRSPGQIVITIQDTGKGISPAFLPHVFERFRQEDSTTTREFFGLGLGLAISKQLVELHGGSISASSVGEGSGATFTLRLPCAVPATLSAAGGAAGSLTVRA
jgi:signal transduction histidine kinase